MHIVLRSTVAQVNGAAVIVAQQEQVWVIPGPAVIITFAERSIGPVLTVALMVIAPPTPPLVHIRTLLTSTVPANTIGFDLESRIAHSIEP